MYYYAGLDGQIYTSPYLLLMDGKPTPSLNPITHERIHYCEQCRRDMGHEWLLGPVCGQCCRKNHRKVIGTR